MSAPMKAEFLVVRRMVPPSALSSVTLISRDGVAVWAAAGVGRARRSSSGHERSHDHALRRPADRGREVAERGGRPGGARICHTPDDWAFTHSRSPSMARSRASRHRPNNRARRRLAPGHQPNMLQAHRRATRTAACERTPPAERGGGRKTPTRHVSIARSSCLSAGQYTPCGGFATCGRRRVGEASESEWTGGVSLAPTLRRKFPDERRLPASRRRPRFARRQPDGLFPLTRNCGSAKRNVPASTARSASASSASASSADRAGAAPVLPAASMAASM